MAGHKGYAISLMIEVLSGMLTGSAFGSAVHGPYQFDQRSGCGHLFIALDVAAFGDRDGFTERMQELVDQLKSLPLAPGFDEVFFPGGIEARAAREHAEHGLILPRTDHRRPQRARQLDRGSTPRPPRPALGLTRHSRSPQLGHRQGGSHARAGRMASTGYRERQAGVVWRASATVPARTAASSSLNAAALREDARNRNDPWLASWSPQTQP
jgi:hypothetical protein